MLAHGPGGGLPVAPQAPAGHLAVLAVGLQQALILRRQHAIAHHLILDGVVKHGQVAVLGGVHEKLVKGVVPKILVRPAGVRVAEKGDEIGVNTVFDAVGVIAHRIGLYAQPRLEKLADVGQGHGVHKYALLGMDGQQLLLLQAADGVAHGRAAGLQPVAQGFLGQLCPGQDLAADDQALQVLVNDLLETLVSFFLLTMPSFPVSW